jgi:hypothetical protein
MAARRRWAMRARLTVEACGLLVIAGSGDGGGGGGGVCVRESGGAALRRVLVHAQPAAGSLRRPILAVWIGRETRARGAATQASGPLGAAFSRHTNHTVGSPSEQLSLFARLSEGKSPFGPGTPDTHAQGAVQETKKTGTRDREIENRILWYRVA